MFGGEIVAEGVSVLFKDVVAVEICLEVFKRTMGVVVVSCNCIL